MSSPLVGSARVEIVGDLAAFGRQTEAAVSKSLHKIGSEVDRGLTGVAADAGRHGEKAGEGMATGMRSRMTRGLGTLKEKMRGQLGDMAKLAGAAFAVTKVKDFFTDSIAEARESQVVAAQTAQVIKSTGGAAQVSAKQVGDLAGAISKKSAIDDEAIQSGQNMLLTFTGVRNEVGAGNDIFNQASQVMTDMSVAMGTDAKGQAIALGKALNDPVKGVAALARVGVTFTAGQKAQIAQMVKTGNTMGAQKIILGELNKEFGGSAAAQATAGKKMGVAWGNFKETIGTALLPVLDKLESVFTDDIIPAMQATFGFLQRHSGVVKVVAIAFGVLAAAIVVAKIGLAAYNLVTGIMAVLSGEAAAATGLQTLALGAQKIALGVSTAAQWLFNAALSANPLVLVTLAIAAMAAGLVLAWKKSETFRRIIKDVWQAVRSAIEFAWKIIKGVYNGIKDGLSAVWGFVKRVGGWISGAFHGIGDGLRWAWNHSIGWAYDKIKGGLHALAGWLEPVITKISNFFTFLGDGIQWAWDHSFGPVIDSIVWGVKKIVAAVKSALDWLDRLTNYGTDKDTSVPGDIDIFGWHPFARGGRLTRGWNLVGEEGPEAIYNSGSRQQVFTAASTRHMAGAGGDSGSDGPVRLHPDDLEALARIVWSRPARFYVGARQLAQAANDGQLELARL